MEYNTITLHGIKHEWIKQGSNKLVVIFPGMGYNIDKPLLYYSKKLALLKGFDVIALSNGESYYDKSKIYDKMIEIADKLNGLESYFEDYQYIIMIAKTIGCVIAGELRARINKDIQNIYLTPIMDASKYFAEKDFIMCGSFDPLLTKSDQEQLKMMNVKQKWYQRANHSLEVEDCVELSITYLKDIIKTIEKLMEVAL